MANIINDLLRPEKGLNLEKETKLDVIEKRLSMHGKRIDEIAKTYQLIRKKLVDAEQSSEKKDLSRIKGNLEGFKEEIDAVRNQQSDVEAAISKLSGEINMLTSHSRKKESQISTLAEKLDDEETEKRIVLLNKKLKLFSNVRDTLVSSINSMERRINSLEKKTMEFNSEKMELAHKAGSLGEKFTKNVELASKLHEKVNLLEKKVEQLSQLSNTLSKEFIDRQRGDSDLDVNEGLLLRLSKIEKEVEEDREKLNARIASVEDAFRNSSVSLTRIEKIESGQMGLADRLEERERELRRVIENLKDEIKSIEGRETVASSEKVMQAVKELSKRQDFFQERSEDIEKISSAIKKMRDDFDQVSEIAGQNQRILAGLEIDDRLKRLEKAMKEITLFADELQLENRGGSQKEIFEKLNRLKSAVETLEQGKNQSNSNEIRILRETRDILNDKVEELSKKVNSLVKRDKLMLSEIEEIKNKDFESEEKNRNVEIIEKNLKADLSELLKKIEKINARVEASTAEFRDVEKRIRTHEKELETIFEKFCCFEEKEPDYMREKISEMEADLRRISDVATQMETELKSMPQKKDIKDLVSIVEKVLSHIGD